MTWSESLKAVAVVACTLVAFLKVTLEGDSFYQTLKRIVGNIFSSPAIFKDMVKESTPADPLNRSKHESAGVDSLEMVFSFQNCSDLTL